MGRSTFSVDAYKASSGLYLRDLETTGSSTYRAEQQARKTGKLNPLVDPAEYGVIRRSLVRFEERSDGLLELTIGTSVPVETRVDTTGSMGHNVDVAIRVLPDAYGLIGGVLPGRDLHMATGIFGDVVDNFVLCRPQFEMVAEKLVDQLGLMVPERGGGDGPEDPHYGIFGGAYLTATYHNCIGLKDYDFTVSDATAHDRLSERQLKRVFGDEVFDKTSQNGFDIDPNDLPSNKELVGDLLKRTHAFFLQVGSSYRDYYSDDVTRFWTKLYGADRVVLLPSTELLPQVQAAIVGLTEGTLALDETKDFLRKNNVSQEDANAIVRSVSNISIGAQAALPNYDKQPNQGDLFREKPDVFNKTNLWPIDPNEIAEQTPGSPETPQNTEGPIWL